MIDFQFFQVTLFVLVGAAIVVATLKMIRWVWRGVTGYEY